MSSSRASANDSLNTEAPTPPVAFPEGGMAAWLTVIGGAAVLFCTLGAVQSFGVFQDYYTRVSLTERTPSEVSWIGSFQLFLLFAMSLVSGKLFDEGYFRHLMALGSLIYVFSYFMLSLARPHNYYQAFLAQGVGIGLAMGILFLPAVSVVSHYFRARRSVAVGVAMSGASVGGIVMPVMLNNLFYHKAGFDWGVRASAFLITCLLIISNIVMRTRLPSRRERPGAVTPDTKKVLTDKAYLIAVAGVFFVFWGLFYPLFYLQLFAIRHGVEPHIAFYSVTILNASSLFGRIVPTFLADSYGPINVIIPITFACGIVLFSMLGAGSLNGMIVFAIFYGFFSGGFLSLSVSTLGSLATNVNEIGLRIGFAMFVASFGLLTGTPIAGALLDAPRYAWYRPTIFSGIVIFFGGFLLIVARSMTAKRRGTWRV
ncbi:MFS general substrate transporter [Hysterangium stoloniferum]|nr:MFS general substrate transporter [Hysterangium stoloniferum]